LNVLTGERYKSITKEAAGVLKGEYGATPAPVNKILQNRVLDGDSPITCRPADLLEPEMDQLLEAVKEKAKVAGITLADNIEEDALIDGLFAQVGWKFLVNRGNPDAFEAAPDPEAFAAKNNDQLSSSGATEFYSVNVDGKNFNVAVGPAGNDITIQPSAATKVPEPVTELSSGAVIEAPMAGNILKINVNIGSVVAEGEVVIIMEAMKMENEIVAETAGVVSQLFVEQGQVVEAGDALFEVTPL
jgi:oxaloacetate decarboxylase alpha subunit